jgi:hypothetical protein
MAASPVLAQDDPLASQVKHELENLKGSLDKVRLLAAMLSTCADRNARAIFADLIKVDMLRNEAEIKYKNALNNARKREVLLKGALKNLQDARGTLEKVETAIKLAIDVLLGSLSRQRNNFGELMRRAEQTVIGSGNRQAERLVYQARRQQTDAEKAAAQRNPCVALVLYDRATKHLVEALGLVQGRRPDPEVTPESAITREKERYDNIATRVREAVETSRNSAARPVFEQAQKQARAAEEAFRKGELVLAQQLYRGAVRLLLRAIDLAMVGQKLQDYGRNEIALLQDLIQTAEQEAKDNMTPREALLLARARILVSEAEAAIERKQAQEAKWRIELARNLIDKVMRKAGRGLGSQENLAQRYDEALQELARDIEEVRAKAREANQPEALQLVELAAVAYQAAENAGAKGSANPLQKLRLAFQMIRAAQYFLLRAETLMRESSTAPPSREAVALLLAQLENSIQELRQAFGRDDPEACQAVAVQATELSKRAQAALERGATRLAIAIAEVAKDLVEQCEKGR